MHLRHLALVPAIGLLVAACSSGGASPSTAPATSSPASSASASQVPTRIEIKLTDTLRIEPASITVPAGVAVTFVVANTGALEHEFYLGDEAAQTAHEQEMQSMGGMGHDEPEGIAVEPGETKDLTFTFTEPGGTLAGCHVAGHYAGGMKATITVTG